MMVDDEDDDSSCDKEIPSSPSSTLSLSSSVCCSNCFVTSPTPPASPSPSASFVPAAKSHTVVHACADEHARACMHPQDTHRDTQTEQSVCGSFQESVSTTIWTWTALWIISFYTIGVNILKGMCTVPCSIMTYSPSKTALCGPHLT